MTYLHKSIAQKKLQDRKCSRCRENEGWSFAKWNLLYFLLLFFSLELFSVNLYLFLLFHHRNVRKTRIEEDSQRSQLRRNVLDCFICFQLVMIQSFLSSKKECMRFSRKFQFFLRKYDNFRHELFLGISYYPSNTWHSVSRMISFCMRRTFSAPLLYQSSKSDLEVRVVTRAPRPRV